jgi:hypothetical protein
VLVEGSRIHDNPWNGLWCDFCDTSSFIVRNSKIVRNGMKGISYEVSGANGAFALITGNTITGNGWFYPDSGKPKNNPAGIVCNDCRDLEVRGNTFGGTQVAGDGRRGAVRLIDTSRADTAYGYAGLPGVVIADNTLAGDVIVGCGLPGVTCSGNG